MILFTYVYLLEGFIIDTRQEDTRHAVGSDTLGLDVPSSHAADARKNLHLQQKRLATPRQAVQCSSQTLQSIFRTCEGALAGSVGPQPATQDSIDDSMFFCGAGCRDRILDYAVACHIPEFILNITGACVVSRTNVTVQCVYAAIIHSGVTSCMKSVTGFENTVHDIEVTSPIDETKRYITPQCCSLQTSFANTTDRNVFVDRNSFKVVVDPPLEPPWVNMNIKDYQPVIEVTKGDLCMEVSTTTTTTEPDTTTIDIITSSSSSSILLETTENGACFTTGCKSGVYVFLCFVCLILTLIIH